MRLNALGPIELVAGGASVALGPPKQRALLALLMIHADRMVPTEVIVDRLWSGRPPTSAHGSLQVYVSHLRRVLEPERGSRDPATVLTGAAGGYGLTTAGLDLDTRRFEGLVAVASGHAAGGRHEAAGVAFGEALALWRGPAYADVRSEDWADQEGDRLEQLRLDATEGLAAARLATGRESDAVALLEPFVQEHPLRERAWAELALAHYRAGRPAQSLATLRRVRAVLADTLGLDPGPALQDLETAVLRHEPTLLLSTDSGSPAPPVERQVQHGFVGRRDALDRLAEAYEASAGAAQVVLIDGEPGVGKTSLVSHFLAGLDVVTARGSSPDHEVAPALWPWEQVLRDLAAVTPAVALPTEICDFLGSRPGSSPGEPASGARLRFFDAVSAYLASLGPVVVVLEDLHAADDATLRLLEYVAASAGPGLLLVVTFRRHQASGLTATRAALSRLGARRIPLDGFDAAEVRAVVELVSGRDPGETAARALQGRTGGNAFFVTELARSDDPLPQGVLDVVLHRVSTLGEDVARTLELAAVIGDTVDLEVLTAVLPPDADVPTQLDAALRAGLIREGPRLGTHVFAHALVADALLSSRSRLWRARAHESVAEVLTRLRGDRDEYAGDLARQWLAAAELGVGPAQQAMEHSARAARAALRRHAPDDAAVRWQDALAAAELGGAGPEQRVDLLIGLAESRYAAGRFDEGYEVAERALALPGVDPGRAVRIADIAMGHGMWLPFRYGVDISGLRDAMDRVVEQLPPESPEWVTAQGVRAVARAHLGEGGEDTLSDRAVARAGRVGELALMQRALHLRLVALQGQDHAAERAATARDLLALPDLPPELHVIAELQLVVDHVQRGEVESGLDLLTGIETRLPELHNPTLVLQTAVARHGIEVFRAEAEPGAALPAPESLADVDLPYFETAQLSVAAERVFREGRLAEEAAWLEEVHRFTMAPGLAFLRCIALADLGRIEAARALLAETELPPRDYQWAPAAVTRLQAAIRLGDEDLVRESHDQLLPFAGRLLVTGTCTTIVGAYDGHLGEALLALGDVATAREHLSRGIDLLERAGAGYWLARARQALDKCS